MPGSHKNLPPQWLIYITVSDLDASAKQCKELGGKLFADLKGMGSAGKYCVIQDLRER